MRDLHVGIVVSTRDERGAREGHARPSDPLDVLEGATEGCVAHVEQKHVLRSRSLRHNLRVVLPLALRRSEHEPVRDAAAGELCRELADLRAPRSVGAAGEVA